MYKTESTLGLIGSIISAVLAFFILVFALLLRILFRMTTFTGSHMFRFFGPAFESGETVAGIAAVVVVVMALLILGGAAVLGFVGTSMLRRENKKGGILLVIAGALTLLPSYIGSGVFGTAISVLFLIGGIMALAKKVNAA